MKHGEYMKQRTGFNPMLSICFDESVPACILDKIGIELRKSLRFAYLEGKCIKSYAREIIPPVAEVRTFCGPRLGNTDIKTQ